MRFSLVHKYLYINKGWNSKIDSFLVRQSYLNYHYLRVWKSNF